MSRSTGSWSTTIFTQHVQQGHPVLDHVLDGPIEKLARYEILICSSVRCGWQGPRPFADVLAAKLQAAGLDGRAGAASRGQVASGPAARPRPASFSHLLVRPDKVLYRVKDEAELDEIIREHSLGGRPVEHLKVPAKPSAASFWSFTATWPSSTARAAWPCGTTA